MRRLTRTTSAALATVMLAGVLVFSAVEPAAAAACNPADVTAWTVTCSTDGVVITETVQYAGPAGSVTGRVCRPTGAGPFPVIVLNHAASGSSLHEAGKCDEHARYRGYIVLASDYRPYLAAPVGDDFCEEEVADVVAMIDHARTLPFVNDDQIVMRGISLGGCITLQIHQQGLPGLQAAASLNGPTDMTATYTHSATQYNNNLCLIFNLLIPQCPDWQVVRDHVSTAIGGPPGPATQAEYDARSPILEAADTAASTVPVALVQGAMDHLITLQQTCAFAAAVNGVPGGAWDFQAVRYGTAGAGFPLIPTAPAGCTGTGSWAHNPVGFPVDRYFFVMDGLAHISPSNEFGMAVYLADEFLFAKD